MPNAECRMANGEWRMAKNAERMSKQKSENPNRMFGIRHSAFVIDRTFE
jgi:hypothetical protein